MPPKIVLIRHAQGYHNVDNNLPDPKLTPLGESQCLTLRESLRQRFDAVPAQDVAVVVSPMVRTLQTASLALDWLAAKGVVFEANANWQEVSSDPCDVGTPLALHPAWPPIFTFDHLDPVWPDKTSPAATRYAPSRAAVVERGRRCLEDLYRRPEKLVFVVSHSAFLRAGCVGWWFFNGDYRIFEFEQGARQDGSRRVLVQDESTISGGLGLSRTCRVPLGDGLPDLSN
ncbi:Histidine phosphatase superfamily, clade-1 [Metarhizium album ARSEF 1941]|uniref:Histidine phosphatase superfamily, clade-1 n=1 Tax=Metarhizium album (strain ARSEF 1941) TaxID=1081103 RepID=A0A0B2WYK7_METAS|nr:Histidine phosphatase superfamily, clade-1 [Metarhizium album ARSEF 1941]KHN98664.1 Histidine phosphatase superfamily, clade-1 [Metarhizium album ARSEF 1941]